MMVYVRYRFVSCLYTGTPFRVKIKVFKVCTYCKCGIGIQVVDDKSICGIDVTSHCIQTKEVGSRQVSIQLVPDLALKMHNQNTLKHHL